MESSSSPRVLFPWEQPEKYRNFVEEELGVVPPPQSPAFQDLPEPDSSRTFDVLEKKKLSVDGIHVNLDEYERVIVQGNLLLDGIHCIAQRTPRVHNGKVLVISKKLVLSGIDVRVSGLEVVEGDVRMDGICCKLDRSVSVRGLVKKDGLGCGFL